MATTKQKTAKTSDVQVRKKWCYECRKSKISTEFITNGSPNISLCLACAQESRWQSGESQKVADIDDGEKEKINGQYKTTPKEISFHKNTVEKPRKNEVYSWFKENESIPGFYVDSMGTVFPNHAHPLGIEQARQNPENQEKIKSALRHMKAQLRKERQQTKQTKVEQKGPPVQSKPTKSGFPNDQPLQAITPFTRAAGRRDYCERCFYLNVLYEYTTRGEYCIRLCWKCVLGAVPLVQAYDSDDAAHETVSEIFTGFKTFNHLNHLRGQNFLMTNAKYQGWTDHDEPCLPTGFQEVSDACHDDIDPDLLKIIPYAADQTVFLSKTTQRCHKIDCRHIEYLLNASYESRREESLSRAIHEGYKPCQECFSKCSWYRASLAYLKKKFTT